MTLFPICRRDRNGLSSMIHQWVVQGCQMWGSTGWGGRGRNAEMKSQVEQSTAAFSEWSLLPTHLPPCQRDTATEGLLGGPRGTWAVWREEALRPKDWQLRELKMKLGDKRRRNDDLNIQKTYSGVYPEVFPIRPSFSSTPCSPPSL